MSMFDELSAAYDSGACRQDVAVRLNVPVDANGTKRLAKAYAYVGDSDTPVRGIAGCMEAIDGLTSIRVGVNAKGEYLEEFTK